MIKLSSLSFDSKFRKLNNLTIHFSDRITLIAGHNGIGKSTILGLVASTSGVTDRGIKSYFSRPFSYDINNIIHLDPSEFENGQLSPPWPKAIYTIKENTHNAEDSSSTTSETSQSCEHWKNISITKREIRLRSVPRTHPDSPNNEISNPDAKIPIPTIYLGMLRMLPIGESDEKTVNSIHEEMNEDDAKCLKAFINSVIYRSSNSESLNITNQTIKNTTKRSMHPQYEHDSKAVSLGQDSLSSIATAVASFHKIKREMGTRYQGGILVIDEIDAGFHPHAQKMLIDALRKYSRKLSLQIVATTHSPILIEYVHPESRIISNEEHRFNNVDNVVYLADTTRPIVTAAWSLEKILADMSLTELPISARIVTKEIKAYFEDEEAMQFLQHLLKMKGTTKTFTKKNQKRKLSLVSLALGHDQLTRLPQKDAYFKKVLLVVDADTTGIPRTSKNVIKLPGPNKFNPEKTLHTYIQELTITNGKFESTARKLTMNGITSDRLKSTFLDHSFNINDRKQSKNWFKSVYDHLKRYNIIEEWVCDHQQIVDDFRVIFDDTLDYLAEIN